LSRLTPVFLRFYRIRQPLPSKKLKYFKTRGANFSGGCSSNMNARGAAEELEKPNRQTQFPRGKIDSPIR
jgi:hypothetical protein